MLTFALQAWLLTEAGRDICRGHTQDEWGGDSLDEWEIKTWDAVPSGCSAQQVQAVPALQAASAFWN